MTVKEMLTIPTIQKCQIIAGHSGLNNTVTTVSVMDAPDIYNWMKGGEFLITSAYPIKNDVDYLSPLMEKLYMAKVAAFGVKFSRFLGSVPHSAIETADRLSLPLISIPEEYAFTDIINPILYRLVDQQAFALYQKEKMHKAFLQKAVHCENTEGILDILCDFVSSPAVFVDYYFHQIHASSNGEEFHRILSAVLTEKGLRSTDVPYYSHAVTNGNGSYGRIFLQQDSAEVSSIQQAAIEYAGVLLALNEQMRISNSRIEERYRNEFLSDLILDNIKSEREIHARAKLYGWSLHHGSMAIIIDINHIKQLYVDDFDTELNADLEATVNTIQDISRQELSACFEEAMYYRQSDFIVFLVSAQKEKRAHLDQDIETVFGRILRRVTTQTPFSVNMGVGLYRDRAIEIAASYQEAKIMIQLAQDMNLSGEVLFFERMGSYRLLAAIQDTQAKKLFIQQYLLPLLQWDQDHNSNLYHTLKTVIQTGWNLKEAAAALYIHYNSIKYRMTKIGDLLQLNLKLHENQLNVELACKLYLINSKNWDIISK